jgi:hypothetical protein
MDGFVFASLAIVAVEYQYPLLYCVLRNESVNLHIQIIYIMPLQLQTLLLIVNTHR